MKKTLLVDLSALRYLYSGLGQVALAYGNYFKENYKQSEASYTLTLLMPKKMFGMFGNEVKYINSRHPLRAIQRWIFPHFDVWHSTHQLSRFRPSILSKNRTKTILTIHDLNYLYETEGTRQKRHHHRLQKKVRDAYKIVCISEFAKKEVEQHLALNGKVCKVIHNGVSDLTLANRVKPAIEITKPFFFSIGVLNPKKNFHVILDIMKLIPKKNFYLAGVRNTEYGLMLEERIKQEGLSNVTLVGPVSEAEKAWFYANCEAFLFPSLFEGFGLPVIEAMQFGKPVFSSKETSLEEIGGDYAYFWDSFAPHDMLQLIEENLDNFYANKNLITKQIAYANSFSQQKHFETYEELYRHI